MTYTMLRWTTFKIFLSNLNQVRQLWQQQHGSLASKLISFSQGFGCLIMVSLGLFVSIISLSIACVVQELHASQSSK